MKLRSVIRNFASRYNLGRDTRRQYDTRVFKVTEEVRDAIATGRPVVALESTIYTHGYPYEQNVELALRLEAVVRENGAVPATIGIIDGVANIGMARDNLIRLASTRGDAIKVSRRDLPFIVGLGVVGKRLYGGTTICGTMVLAQMAGIEVLGTGGLGGVHRGGENSLDISADLTELGRTAVTVIASGCKNFLDLPRTLEYLETEGVCVSTFTDGRTGNISFPSFYSRDSEVQSPSVVHNEKEAAGIIYARRLLDIQSGILLANPITAEYSIPASELRAVIDQAVEAAAEKGIHGSANTPFILAMIKKRTSQTSIAANRSTIEGNVATAARVSVELSKLKDLESRWKWL